MSIVASNENRISIVVPVRDGSATLRQCLAALQDAETGADEARETIVVDDASTEDLSWVTGHAKCRLLRLPENRGPAGARNHGARHARGDIVFFVDADVKLPPGAVRQVADAFRERPEVSAVFGSYDAEPAAEGWVSRYRNLLHHYVHQRGASDAFTFWAGCGAIRRDVFERVGGFDEERFRAPSIEDIELGYRLRAAGHRILLEKTLQAKHLKRWTLVSMIRTDLCSRAIPWTRLILETGIAPRDLNLGSGARASMVLVGIAVAGLALGALTAELLAVSIVALLAMAAINAHLFAFLARRGGVPFAVACIPLHAVHHFTSGLGYLYACMEHRLKPLAGGIR